MHSPLLQAGLASDNLEARSISKKVEHVESLNSIGTVNGDREFAGRVISPPLKDTELASLTILESRNSCSSLSGPPIFLSMTVRRELSDEEQHEKSEKTVH
ncbi:hypothetical protein M5K25_017522 [Dendrobium thyrsiflorum]|uniref:Uncharacterized protein n=1 Tax=Dendrobium thyrsiflorum TaxID=117978 RepID=A0ABD0UN14_DENTH